MRELRLEGFQRLTPGQSPYMLKSIKWELPPVAFRFMLHQAYLTRTLLCQVKN